MNFKEALSRAQNLCSKRELCSSEVYKKLMEWDVNEENADKIIWMLKKENFLNDGRYIKSYIHDKFNILRWGKIKIRHQLIIKGFDEKLVQNALDEINEDGYKESLEFILKRKAAQIKSGSKREKQQKLMSFAYQKGYSFDDCYDIIQNLLNLQHK